MPSLILALGRGKQKGQKSKAILRYSKFKDSAAPGDSVSNQDKQAKKRMAERAPQLSNGREGDRQRERARERK